MIDTAELLLIARGTVALADDLLRTRKPAVVRFKGDRDMASDLDTAIEQEVREFLRETTPHIGFLGEEEGRSGELGELTWVLDPIDGTANFVHGLPLHAVSLALVADGRPVVGVISTSLEHIAYCAVDGGGAYLGDERIHASPVTDLKDAIIALGDYAVGEHAEEKNVARFAVTRQLAKHVQRVRMLGSAAIDLAWVAQGRLAGSVMLSNKPWDTAAGVLLAREAGAVVVDAKGNPHTHQSSSTIAVAPALSDMLIDLLNPASR